MRALERTAPPLAVTFDFWNTLMWEEPGSLKSNRLDVWKERLADSGVPIDQAGLEVAHDAAHNAYVRAWREGRQFLVEDAAALIADGWDDAVVTDVQGTLVDGFSEAGRRAAVHRSEGVRKCLSMLRDRSVRLAIVCDIGLTPSPVVRSLLERERLLDFFEEAAFSDEVGCYKPSPAIFEKALAGLGDVPPEVAAHVGDRRRTDVAGALALGMTAIRYNGVYEDEVMEGPEAHLVVENLVELPALLGVIGGE